MITSTLNGGLYNKKTLFTLGGASGAVWMLTGVICYVFNVDIEKYKWIGLIASLFLSFLGLISPRKFDLTTITLAFFNGLLIFVTASGIDSINSGMYYRDANIQQANILHEIGNKYWWPPVILKDSIKILRKTNSNLNGENVLFKDSILVLLDYRYKCIEKQNIIKEKDSIINELRLFKTKYINIKSGRKCATRRELDNDIKLGAYKYSIDKRGMYYSKEKIRALYDCNNRMINKILNFNEAGCFPRGTNLVSYLQKDLHVFYLELKRYNDSLSTYIGCVE